MTKPAMSRAFSTYGPIRDRQLIEQIHEYALAAEPESVPMEHGFVNNPRGGNFAAGARFRRRKGGPLRDLLFSRDVLEFVQQSAQSTGIIPARCGFNYYRNGDYLGVHRDIHKCSFTCTFGITGNLAPMHLSLTLGFLDNNELEKYANENGICPTPEIMMPVEAGVLRGFNGNQIPHWRPPHAGALEILATLCFFDAH